MNKFFPWISLRVGLNWLQSDTGQSCSKGVTYNSLQRDACDYPWCEKIFSSTFSSWSNHVEAMSRENGCRKCVLNADQLLQWIIDGWEVLEFGPQPVKKIEAMLQLYPDQPRRDVKRESRMKRWKCKVHFSPLLIKDDGARWYFSPLLIECQLSWRGRVLLMMITP